MTLHHAAPHEQAQGLRMAFSSPVVLATEPEIFPDNFCRFLLQTPDNSFRVFAYCCPAMKNKPKHPVCHLTNAIFSSLLLCLVSGGAIAQMSAHDGAKIGYIEEFALSEDREKALEQLIPGSEDYYYYHCLHYQNLGEYDQVEQFLDDWSKQMGNGEPRWREIKNRQMLLRYEESPETTIKFLTDKFRPNLNHQRSVPGSRSALPSELDGSIFSWDSIYNAYFRNVSSFSRASDEALPRLLQEDLSESQLRDLLRRLSRPDYPGVESLVRRELGDRNSGGFGSLPIHEKLLLSQMDALWEQDGSLLSDEQFVAQYLQRLAPPDGVNISNDESAHDAFLMRLEEFTSKLPPVYDSLKAEVLYNRLQFDHARGIYNKEKFLTYLSLPRPQLYYQNVLSTARNQKDFKQLASFNRSLQEFEFLPISEEETLVRDYLLELLVEAEDYSEFERYLKSDFLRKLFAEAKLLAGVGSSEEWFSMLSAEELRQLKDRVDLEFLPSNPKEFARDDTVSLELRIKNVSTLIVRTYEINTDNYYRQNLDQITTAVDLDGLVANEIQTFEYNEPALRQFVHKFDFPKLEGSGAWIVEFIGNGKTSRAVVRKGRLQAIVESTAAGQALYIYDEKNQPVSNASVWINGQYYTAKEETNEVYVPYSKQPGRTPIVISDGEFSSLDHYQAESEQYALKVSFNVLSEQLVRGNEAEVAIRPLLTVNGRPAPIELLEDVQLDIRAVTMNAESTSTVADLELKNDAETVHRFVVPPALRSLSFELRGKVTRLSDDEEVSLSDADRLEVNTINGAQQFASLYLAKTTDGYIADVLGKSGEPLRRAPVYLNFEHKWLAGGGLSAALQTNEKGQLKLGSLPGVTKISWRIESEGNPSCEITLTPGNVHNPLPDRIQTRANEEVLIPYVRVADDGDTVSLISLREGAFAESIENGVRIEDGFLKISGLQEGDYSLYLRDRGHSFQLKVAAGDRSGRWILGSYRHLESSPVSPLQIVSAQAVDDREVEIQLANSNDETRVHLAAVRYLPRLLPELYFEADARFLADTAVFLRPRVSYESGRLLGEKYRYVIERQYAKKYPGNLLQRPSLLLNPWELQSTETTERKMAAGEDFAGETEADEALLMEAAAPPAEPGISLMFSRHGALDFLESPAAVLTNLVPDEEGKVRVPIANLDGKQMVRIVAVSGKGRVIYDLPLAPAELQPKDLRLQKSFDAEIHRAQTKGATVLEAGKTHTLIDAALADYLVYDDLGKVFQLLQTLLESEEFDDFSFLLEWPDLSDQEKREKYSEFASHELHFFIYKKDRAFFDQIIAPYLANKTDKTFLDEWLLEADLDEYLELQSYQRLNIFERILLAERMGGAAAEAIQREIAELYEVNPPDPGYLETLNDTALFGQALVSDESIVGGYLASETGDGAGGRTSDVARDRLVTDIPPGSGLAQVTQSESASAAPAPMSAPAQEEGVLLRLQRGLSDDNESERRAQVLQTRENIKSKEGQLFRQIDKTKEWAENNYYERPIAEQNASLITVSGFWRDYAQHGDGPFYSDRFVEASRNYHEALLALALLDLPFKAPETETEPDGNDLKITPGGPAILFSTDLGPAELDTEKKDSLFVRQNFYALSEPYTYDAEGQQSYKYISDDLLTHAIYLSHVVLTNTTSSNRKVTVLAQVPEGAIPVGQARFTDVKEVTLAPYSASVLTQAFYFPASGEFPVYPVQVSEDEKLIGFAETLRLNVVDELDTTDKASWEYISQVASDNEVLEYLKTSNLRRLDLGRIAFRMQDQAFFNRTLGFLRDNYVYEARLWAYGLKHNDRQAIEEYLNYQNGFVDQCGLYLESPILKIDPVEWNFHQHLEYYPLINIRAHQLASDPEIFNPRLLQQYQNLLRVLTYYPALQEDHHLAVAYYMFLQDRVTEGLAFLGAVSPQDTETELQHDYFTAYASLYTEDLDSAKAQVAKYKEFPVNHWRKRFEEVGRQLKEIETGELDEERLNGRDEQRREREQLRQGARQPKLSLTMEGPTAIVEYSNVEKLEVNYYLMDVEMLFTSNPFLVSNGSNGENNESRAFSIIRPNRTDEVSLDANEASMQFEVPGELANKNLIIEVSGAGVKETTTYYANSLRVETSANYGQLQVRHRRDRKSLSKIYVKVYSRERDGNIRFYKDGYTDLRGVFDYASVSSNALDRVEKFSILVLSEEYGAEVIEVNPPQR